MCVPYARRPLTSDRSFIGRGDGRMEGRAGQGRANRVVTTKTLRPHRQRTAKCKVSPPQAECSVSIMREIDSIFHPGSIGSFVQQSRTRVAPYSVVVTSNSSGRGWVVSERAGDLFFARWRAVSSRT